MSVIRTSLVALLVASCGSSSPFPCTESSQCVRGDDTGLCSQGYCAFVDTSCAGGYRFADSADDSLAGTCVEQETTCGGIGQACCAGDAACIGGASCNAGTCESCATELALGRRHTCYLDALHHVWCAGDNSSGQLGNGNVGLPTATRAQVIDSTTSPIADATQISAGASHTCALRSGGSVWCWGNNNSGAIGTNTSGGSVTAATRVVTSGNAPLTNITQVAASDSYTCALDTSGAVSCWGYNAHGGVGDNTTLQRNAAVPVLATGAVPLTGVAELVVGGDHTCARKTNDEAWCWGRNIEGEMGDGTITDHLVATRVATTTSIAAGRRYTCYVNADSTVSCQGWAAHGRLGLGTAGYWDSTAHTAAALVQKPDGTPQSGIAKVFAGGAACALTTDGAVLCWGDDKYGETGNGGSGYPLAVRTADGKPLTGVDRLRTGWGHVCAHRTGDEWLCWGRNAQGDYGMGTFANIGFATPLKASCR